MKKRDYSKEETIVKYKIWLSILLVISFLTGCSLPLGNSKQDSGGDDRKETLGLTPDFSYEVKEQLPNILINQLGYLPVRSKVAILQGNDLENVFYVYNAVTMKQEYTGTLKPDSLFKEKKEETEESEQKEIKKENYLADFSAIDKPGTYYIYHPDLGYSYEFSIKENIYSDVEKSLLTLIESENKDTSLICYQLTCLLFAKELYPESIAEAEKLDLLCKQKIECLLQAQDEKTGSVYANAAIAYQLKNKDEAQKQQYISLAATAEFAGVMAMYAYEEKESDREFALKCRDAAEKAYGYIQNSLDNVGYDAGYFASAYLYRLTGKGKYSRAIQQYVAMKEEQKSYTEYDFSLFGDYAYLTLPQGTKLEIGESLMKKNMSKAEQISLTSKRNNFYVSEKREYNDIDGMLRDISAMSLINYVITNHEYSTMLENYIDYLLGRNSQNICFMDGYGMRNAGQDSSKINEVNAGLFYLLLQSAGN